MTEFDLSRKIKHLTEYQTDNWNIPLRDVKKFIRLLKDKIRRCRRLDNEAYSEARTCDDLDKEINKLVGDKLI